LRGVSITLLLYTFALAVATCKRQPPPRAKNAPVPIATGRAGYVTNNGSDTLTVLDRDGTATFDVAVDLDPSAHEAPHHLAIDPVRQTVFVALAFPPDPTTVAQGKHGTHGASDSLGVLARLDLGTLSVDETKNVDQNPGDVVLTHDRSHALVTHFDMKKAMDEARAGKSGAALFATLQIWDAATMTKLGERAICAAPHGVATTKDDKTAYVACYGSDELVAVDLSQPALPVAHHPLGSAPGVLGAPRYGPYSATLAPDETIVLVASTESNELRVFDVGERRFVAERTLALGAKAMMPAFVGNDVALVPLAAPDGLARIDVRHGAVVRRVAFDAATCEAPHAVKVAADGRAYVVCEGNKKDPGAVIEVDPTMLDVKKRWKVGVYPDGIAFAE
jgi:DNA-binding beta-propeller fold protein YncE